MKQKYKTNAINLKSYDFGEADKIVIMYSKDKGLIRCMAKGSKKPNGKLGGRMDMFVANNLLLSKGRSMDTVSQAEVLNSFFVFAKVQTGCSIQCIVRKLSKISEKKMTKIVKMFMIYSTAFWQKFQNALRKLKFFLQQSDFSLKLCVFSVML